jgi:hypothetical protein
MKIFIVKHYIKELKISAKPGKRINIIKLNNNYSISGNVKVEAKASNSVNSGVIK